MAKIITPEQLHRPTNEDLIIQLLDQIAGALHNLTFGLNSYIALQASIHNMRFTETPQDDGNILANWVPKDE